MSKITNMNYFFNKQYFESIDENMKISDATQSNNLIKKYVYKKDWKVNKPCNIEGVSKFHLFTAYPGLMIGIGYMHDVKCDDAIKCGFSFDYVTGYPYLPGSSIKGILRSYFPANNTDEKEINKKIYIETILGKENIDVESLRDNIFNNGDVFLDVFPGQGSVLLDEDYITPHNKGKFKNPVPIKLLKVRPNKKFDFCFLLNDYCDKDGGKIVSKEDKLNLFRQIVLDMGVGAKINVGFGKFIEEKIPEQKSKSSKQSNISEDVEAPECKHSDCRNRVTRDRTYNKWFSQCLECKKKGRK